MIEEKKMALLIDCDNISSRYIDRILSELSKYGKVTYKRMYGDWSKQELKPWLAISAKHSLTPVMQPNDTPGKNASDIGLIIEAMDILYSNEVEGFCIVSSDGDFNKLAKRIREAGKLVVGMGEKKTPESFRASCERFIYLDILENGDEAEGSRNLSNGNEKYCDKDSLITPKKEIEDTIIKMIYDTNDNEMDLSEIGNRLVKIYPDFDVRNYNYSKLSAFLKDFDNLSVVNRPNSICASLKITSIKTVRMQILEIFRNNNTVTMNIGELKRQLLIVNPNLDATIKDSGVTKFSTFLDKKIEDVEVDNNQAILIKF